MPLRPLSAALGQHLLPMGTSPLFHLLTFDLRPLPLRWGLGAGSTTDLGRPTLTQFTGGSFFVRYVVKRPYRCA